MQVHMAQIMILTKDRSMCQASHTSLEMRFWQEDSQHTQVLWWVREVNDRYGLPDLASGQVKAVLVQLGQRLPLSAEADGMGQ